MYAHQAGVGNSKTFHSRDNLRGLEGAWNEGLQEDNRLKWK